MLRDASTDESLTVTEKFAKNVGQTAQASVNYLKNKLSRGIKQVAHDTMANAAMDDSDSGVLFARIPQGKTCTYCLNIAAAGYCFPTAQQAGEFTKFHNNCDCVVVPSWTAIEYSQERYVREELEETSERSESSSVEEFVLILELMFDESPNGRVLVSEAENQTMIALGISRNTFWNLFWSQSSFKKQKFSVKGRDVEYFVRA